MRAYERAKLRDELRMAAEEEVRFDPGAESVEPPILEMRGGRPRERLVLEVGERASTPKPEGGAKYFGSPSRIARLESRPTLTDEVLELLEVELARFQSKHVPRRLRDENGCAVGKHLAKTRYVRLQRHPGVLRWRLAPELVDEPIARDELVRPEQKDRENSSLLRAAEVEGVLAFPDLERPQDAEVEHGANVPPLTSRTKPIEALISGLSAS
jgi:hypothetical protein